MRALAVAIVAGASGDAAAQTATPSASPSVAGLSRGDRVPSFAAEGIDGAIRRVDFEPGSATVLLFFLSSCPTCHRMIPMWNQAYERRPRNLQVVGVLLDQEPPGFFMATPISFPVVRAPGATASEKRAFSGTFKVHRVPVTLRVGPGGKVEDVALGQVDLIRLGEIFRP
ncbi:MAG: TlpA family protein disulfide reductase [Acidobacteria bacterium]|nr:TlpA family protein disulfide reductase [Acidobacteriota bacterium]